MSAPKNLIELEQSGKPSINKEPNTDLEIIWNYDEAEAAIIVEHLRNSPQLTSLLIWNSHNCSNASFARIADAIGNLPRLTSLSIVNLNDNRAPNISGIFERIARNLTSFSVDCGSQGIRNIVANLPQLANLRSLSIKGQFMDGELTLIRTSILRSSLQNTLTSLSIKGNFSQERVNYFATILPDITNLDSFSILNNDYRLTEENRFNPAPFPLTFRFLKVNGEKYENREGQWVHYY